MENHHHEDQNGVIDGSRSALIFLGTGCSSAVPNAMCLIQPSDPPCHVCFQSMSLPPDRNPNYRCNTSLLIDYCHSDGKHYYILIDVGKNFREQVLRWFTYHKIPQVDSIILTHEHADAVLGLDDIRAVQPHSPTNDIDPTPVYLSQYAMESIAMKFPYLVRKKLIEGQEVRRVAQMEWNIIEEQVDKPFVASGLKFIPLPVMHGEDYISLGFLFGENCRVAYISDVSRFPSSTEYVISKTGRGNWIFSFWIHYIRIKVKGHIHPVMFLPPNLSLSPQMDATIKGSHNVHFCLPQTLDALKRICPRKALLIGMTHDFDHHKANEFLAEWSKRKESKCNLHMMV